MVLMVNPGFPEKKNPVSKPSWMTGYLDWKKATKSTPAGFCQSRVLTKNNPAEDCRLAF
jgi:hypothetical protein